MMLAGRFFSGLWASWAIAIKTGWSLSSLIHLTISSVKTTMKCLPEPERDTRTGRFSLIASTMILLSTRFEFEYGGIQ